jgi:hypothetical protein
MKPLIMQFSPASCHFFSSWSKHSPQPDTMVTRGPYNIDKRILLCLS